MTHRWFHRLGVAALAAFALTGCAQQYYLVELRAGDMERARQAVGVHAEICNDDGQSLGSGWRARPRGDDQRGQPGDPQLSLYRLGPSSDPGVDRTPSPLLATSIPLSLFGGIGLMASAITLFPCLGPAGCDFPDWAAPLAAAGAGTMALGGALALIGTILPKAGTAPRPYTVTHVKPGHICAQ